MLIFATPHALGIVMLDFIQSKVSDYLAILAVSLLLLVVLPYIATVQMPHQSASSISDTTNVTFANTEIKPDNLRKQLEARGNIVRISNYPVKGGKLTSGYGLRKDPIHGRSRMHSGIDIAAVNGTFVYPMGKGKVIFAGRKGSYGNVLEIQHGNSVISRYAHLEMLLIDVGREVSKEDIVALVGNTGRSTGPHLHLEVFLNKKKVDPEIFLAGDVAKIFSDLVQEQL